MPSPSKVFWVLVAPRQDRSGNLLLLRVLHNVSSEKQKVKNFQGFAKVFSHYQPLRAVLSGVWDGSQAEWCGGMEQAGAIWYAGFELG